ncbi:MAG: hypothetical protein AB7O59_15350 [Pirellulales bacterium]
MPKVSSREYKVMLDHRLLQSRKAAVAELLADLARTGERVGAPLANDFDVKERRTIEFLDTADCLLRRNSLILRRRLEADGGNDRQFTLKCRSPDRYVAEHAQVHARRKHEPQPKFEEDIAPPFRSRFSHSSTVKVDKQGAKLPKTVAAAAKIFPLLAALNEGDTNGRNRTPLVVVNDFQAKERVWKGPVFALGGDVLATVALIFWSYEWKSRTIAAELSFRYGDKREQYDPLHAQLACDLFAAVQALEWCLPEGATKTQFAYGGA